MVFGFARSKLSSKGGSPISSRMSSQFDAPVAVQVQYEDLFKEKMLKVNRAHENEIKTIKHRAELESREYVKEAAV